LRVWIPPFALETRICIVEVVLVIWFFSTLRPSTTPHCTTMPRPSKKKGDGPTPNAPDLACQGRLPRNTTVAEDVIVAPRSAGKRASGVDDFDGDDTGNRATSSKANEVKSERATKKKGGNGLLASVLA
jgi:hypothetical protein